MIIRPFYQPFVFAVLWYLVCFGQVQAEVYGPPGDFGWRKSVPMHLVMDGAVISDLELNEDVARKLRELQNGIQKELDEAFAKARSSPDPKARVYLPKELVGKNPEMMHTIRNQHMEQINALLTREQQNRLHQIHLQYGTLSSNARVFSVQVGLGHTRKEDEADVLSDSAVAMELGLTDDQRKQIRDIHFAITRAEGAKVKQGKSYNGPNYLNLMNERSEKIISVLTDEQRSAFEDLQGKRLSLGPSKRGAMP
jgi:Spy/CpxP family protein refolding chaperone